MTGKYKGRLMFYNVSVFLMLMVWQADKYKQKKSITVWHFDAHFSLLFLILWTAARNVLKSFLLKVPVSMFCVTILATAEITTFFV